MQSQRAKGATQEQMKPPVAQPSSSTGMVPAPRVGADSTDLGREGLLVEQVTIPSDSGAASRREIASGCSTDTADLSRAAGDL